MPIDKFKGEYLNFKYDLIFGDKLGTKLTRFYFNLPYYNFINLVIVRVCRLFAKKTF